MGMMLKRQMILLLYCLNHINVPTAVISALSCINIFAACIDGANPQVSCLALCGLWLLLLNYISAGMTVGGIRGVCMW